MGLRSINPSTGELLEEFAETTPSELERILATAERAFTDWRGRSFAARGGLVREAARLLRARRAEYARAMALEMGKPLAQGEAEIEKCAVACEWYAEHAARLLAEDARPTDAARSYVRFDPLGPVLAVMPWNFPFWQVFRFAAPALMAGNVAVLKHASSVSRCALEIEQVLRAAGIPEGVFSTVLVASGAVGGLIADPRIRAVTLTGSEGAGRDVASRAGRELKKTVLELGGSDPFIVLDDADPDATAKAAASARLVNSGQSCIAAKRFIVVDGAADRFVERFVAEMAARRMGDPLAPGVEVGPQARRELRDALHAQVDATVARGARLLLGGRVPGGPAAFYPPTVLDDVRPGTAAFDEETFGPVAAVVRARDESEAVALANASAFGLGASIWSADPARAERLAPRIEAGSVFVNALVRSDPRLPFGGVKRSGYGRELAEYGLREFVDVKTVWVA
jgi:succinate-semialdehyde dehydrogenase/glutarate-semialdehyde dehydrogenase